MKQNTMDMFYLILKMMVEEQLITTTQRKAIVDVQRTPELANMICNFNKHTQQDNKGTIGADELN